MSLIDRFQIIRPDSLDEFIGHKKVIENLKVFIKAAIGRNEPLEHIIISGPPGVGKTTLANIIAKEMGVQIISTSGHAIEKTGDLAAMLSSLEHGDILFIDEIHRLKPNVEEILYTAMEDFFIDIVVGSGISAKSVKVSLNPFTLIGATTRKGLLSSPLLSRFGIHLELDFYDLDALISIGERTCKVLKINMDKHALVEVARRSRGTPRVLNSLIKRIRDFSEVYAVELIDRNFVEFVFDKLRIDSMGLTDSDVKLLKVIIEKHNGGPVGIKSLSVSLGEDVRTIEEVYEPYLINIGFLKRTSKGRVATPLAYKHLGYELDEGLWN